MYRENGRGRPRGDGLNEFALRTTLRPSISMWIATRFEIVTRTPTHESVRSPKITLLCRYRSAHRRQFAVWSDVDGALRVTLIAVLLAFNSRAMRRIGEPKVEGRIPVAQEGPGHLPSGTLQESRQYKACRLARPRRAPRVTGDVTTSGPLLCDIAAGADTRSSAKKLYSHTGQRHLSTAPNSCQIPSTIVVALLRGNLRDQRQRRSMPRVITTIPRFTWVEPDESHFGVRSALRWPCRPTAASSVSWLDPHRLLAHSGDQERTASVGIRQAQPR